LQDGAVSTAKLADSSVEDTHIVTPLTSIYKTGLIFGDASTLNAVSFATSDRIRVLINNGSGSSTQRLDITASSNTLTGTWQDVSDCRWKNLEGPVHNDPLNALDLVDGVQWTWTADGTAGAGIIAQDFARVCPQAVSYNDTFEGYVVNYNAVVGFNICCSKALKQQTVQVQAALHTAAAHLHRSSDSNRSAGDLDGNRSAGDLDGDSSAGDLDGDLQEEARLQEQVAALNARVTAALLKLSSRAAAVSNASRP
jgi:hypothetical protein